MSDKSISPHGGTRVARAAATGAGRAIGGVVSVLSRVRPADKPVHPRGQVLTARLRRSGGAQTGAAFLDEAGEDAVLVRFSRSLGLPAPWPDVDGLALRVPTPGQEHPHADVLLATSGRGRWSRYALLPTLGERSGFLGSLVPYDTPTGAVHLGARALDNATWELVWAHARGGWTAYAVLELDDQPGQDLDLSFDVVTVAPPGMEVPGWLRRVRGPSYAAARKMRGAVSPHEVG